MQLAADIATGFLAFIHVYILVLEMFLFKRAVKVFGVPRELREVKLIKVMLQNQGIYNGFLAAGLIWGLVHPDPAFALQIKLFFCGCIAVAGLVGAATAQVRILLIQTVPASIAAVLLLLA
ncbi:MAG: putative membrane protein [Myxococcota bacterium]|jgi:putative membrane protein